MELDGFAEHIALVPGYYRLQIRMEAMNKIIHRFIRNFDQGRHAKQEGRRRHASKGEELHKPPLKAFSLFVCSICTSIFGDFQKR